MPCEGRCDRADVMAGPAQAREIVSSMASLAPPSGGAGLELRVAADAAAVRLLLAQARHEEAAESAAALFTVCIRAGYQVGSAACNV